MIAKLRRLPDWAWLVLIATALRLPTLAAENMWYDEAFTARVAQTDPANVWAAILGDVHPPLWYGLEWLIAHTLGSSEFWLRLPALIFGVVAVVLVWRITARLNIPGRLKYFDRRTRFLAGLLAALWPAGLYYSQEARMYTLLLCAVLWAIDSALRHQWPYFCLACIVACYSHNIGVLHVAVIGLAVLLGKLDSWGRYLRTCGGFIAWQWFGGPLIALFGVFLAWLPWALIGARAQVGALAGGYWLPPLTLPALVWPYLSMSIGVRMGDPFQLLAYATILLMIAVALLTSRSWLRTREGLLIVAAIFGTPLLTALISFVWRNIYMHRTLLPSVSLLVLPMAYALTHLGKPNRRLAWLAVTPVLAIALVAHYFPAQGRDNMDRWLDPIAYEPGDVIYHLTVDSDILVSYYRPTIPARLFPESNDLSQSLTDETKAALGFEMLPFDQLPSEGFRRAWLISNLSPMTTLDEMIAYQHIITHYRTQVVRDDGPEIARTKIILVELP